MTHADSGAVPTTAPQPTTDEPEASAAPDTLDIQKVFVRSWQLFAAAPIAYMLAGLILTVGSTVTAGILFAPLFVGLVQMVDRHLRDEEIEAGQVLNGFSRFGPSFVTALLFFMGTFLAGIAFVIPGVILGVLWSFAGHYVALESASATDALRDSWNLVRNNIGSVLLVLLSVIGVHFLGSLVVVGFIVAGPLGIILMTLSFRELTRQQ